MVQKITVVSEPSREMLSARALQDYRFHREQQIEWLLEETIDTEDRGVSWYSIRRSTATYLSHEYDLSAAQTQMRHQSPATTMRYDQTPVEELRNALERL